MQSVIQSIVQITDSRRATLNTERAFNKRALFLLCAMQDVNYRAQVLTVPGRTGSYQWFRETGVLVAQRIRPLRLISHAPGRRQQSVISKSEAMRNLVLLVLNLLIGTQLCKISDLKTSLRNQRFLGNPVPNLEMRNEV